MSVAHCTDVGLVTVTDGGFPCGEPIGWCENEELDNWARDQGHGEFEYIGLRIFNEHFGDCWGHALKQHLPRIFESV